MTTGQLNESDVMNQSITMKSYQKQVAQYYQSLVDTFKQIDKNNDDFIDQDELVEFLDSKMPQGKVFDRNILQKIFEFMDTNNDGKVSVSYVEKQEELKIHLEGIKSYLEIERENLKKFEKLKNENKNEILNKDGICNNSKFLIEIMTVNLINNNMVKKNKNLLIKMKLEDDKNNFKKTSIKKINDLVFNEKFEFSIKTLQIPFSLELYNQDDIFLGSTTIPLNSINNQDENEIELEIVDEKMNPNFVINAKINLIVSFYKLYQDSYNKSEREYNKYLAMMDKINSALENFNEPFKYIQNVGNENINNKSNIELMMNTHTTSVTPVSKSANLTKVENNLEYNYADKIENVVKNTLSKNI